MNLQRNLTFLARFAVLGLTVALLATWLYPKLMQHARPVVQIQQASTAAPIPTPAPLSYAAAVQRASPAVVNIFSARVVNGPQALSERPEMHPFFEEGLPQPGPRQIQTGLGSGVIFSPQGYVLTNYHVIAGADEIKVMLADGRNAGAELVGSDPDTDLSVLRIQLPDLPIISLGDSDTLQVGDVVLAIGNPYGVGQTVTQGIVSATGRKRLGLNTYENFIQTDAAINPGNSGGALVTGSGDLVGINTAIFSRTGGSQGIGFAIPVSLARQVLTEMIEHGQVLRGWLGVSMTNVTPRQAEKAGLEAPSGVLVAGVLDDSPANRADLRPGDILTKVNQEPVTDARHMLELVARHKPGSEIVVEGVREGEGFRTRVVVAQRPQRALLE